MEQPYQTLMLLYSIFQPGEIQRRLDFDLNNGSFVHYCSADTACKIIDSNCVWLRDVALMNDYSEFEYGLVRWSRLLGQFGG
jgi:hypothetical protein